MSKPMLCLVSVVASAALMVITPQVQAEFEISVESGMIDPGGALLIEIGIDSSDPPENLAEYELVLQIQEIGTPTPGTSLQFVNPQSEVVLEDAEYVFAATSDVIADPEGFLTEDLTPTSVTFVDLSFVGEDFVDVPVNGFKLLATVDVEHLLGGNSAAATAGDQFRISVDLDETQLFNAAGDPFIPTATSGVITVGAVAIPEPTSVSLLAMLSCGIYLRRRR